jgi:hypothetical protein
MKLQAVFGDSHIILVDTTVNLDSSRCVHGFTNEVQVYVSLSVFGLKPIIGIIRSVIMIVPNADYFCRFLKFQIIYSQG